ncbi:contact-dependent growth inhibition system immunity protein [Pseudomonas spelaei]
MKKTFRQIDESNGFKWEVEPDPDESALESWHRSILDTPITELDIGDLCRSARQDMYTSELLPIVVRELDKEVLVGFLDDAELLKGISKLSEAVWAKNLLLTQKMLNILRRDKELIAVEPRAVEYAQALERKLLAALNGK